MIFKVRVQKTTQDNRIESVESIYECMGIIMQNHRSSMTITFEGQKGFSLSVQKDDSTELFLENDDGKTIDRWSWPRKPIEAARKAVPRDTGAPDDRPA